MSQIDNTSEDKFILEQIDDGFNPIMKNIELFTNRRVIQESINLLRNLWVDEDGNICLTKLDGLDYQTQEELIDDLQYELKQLDDRKS